MMSGSSTSKTRRRVLAFLAFWVPLLCVATMVAASIAYGFLGNANKCVFWILDAAITAWSAFMLQ